MSLRLCTAQTIAKPCSTGSMKQPEQGVVRESSSKKDSKEQAGVENMRGQEGFAVQRVQNKVEEPLTLKRGGAGMAWRIGGCMA